MLGTSTFTLLGRDRERALAGPAGRAPCASAADVSCGAQVAEMVHFMENSNFFWASKFLLSSTALPNVLKDSNSWKEKMAVVLRTGGTACDSEPPCEPGAERGDHGPLGSEDPASSPRALGPLSGAPCGGRARAAPDSRRPQNQRADSPRRRGGLGFLWPPPVLQRARASAHR